MRFAQYVPVVGALAGFAQASPAPFNVVNTAANMNIAAALDGDLEARTLFKPSVFHLANTWEDEVLFSGHAGSNLSLSLGLHKAAISGDIQMKVTDKFLKEPSLKVSLSGVKAYFEIDLAASAATFETVELVSSGRLNLDIPGLMSVQAGTAFALDLVVGISAAVEVRGGFYVSFPENSFVEISVLTKEVVRQSLDGLIAQPLDIALGASVDLSTAVELTLGLRMRSAVGIGAEVAVIGVDTNADIILWLDLFSYTATLVRTNNCAVFAEESFALGVGVAVEADVDLATALSLEIAPMVFITISRAEMTGFCMASVGSTAPGGLPIGAGSGSGNGTSTAANSTGSGSGFGTGSGNGAPAAGNGTGSASGSGSGSKGPGSALSNSTITSSAASGQVTPAPSGYTTSTISSTKTYTITSCAASVKNCPASLTQKVVTSTVIATTTVCPIDQTTTVATTVTQTTCVVPKPINQTKVTTITLTSCPAETSTFTEPEGVKTPSVPIVTITDSPPPVVPTTTGSLTSSTSTNIKPPMPIGTGNVYPPMSTGTGGVPPKTASQSVPYPTKPVNTQPPAGGETGGMPPKPTAPVAITTAPPATAGAAKVFGGFATIAMPFLAMML